MKYILIGVLLLSLLISVYFNFRYKIYAEKSNLLIEDMIRSQVQNQRIGFGEPDALQLKERFVQHYTEEFEKLKKSK